jgi:hypothetical protein
MVAPKSKIGRITTRVIALTHMPSVGHLQFADDILIFAKVEDSQVVLIL